MGACLVSLKMNGQKNFEEKLKTLPLTNKNARDFVRFFSYLVQQNAKLTNKVDF